MLRRFRSADHPTDAWWSKTGSKWKVLPGTSWNATTPDLAKYDFDSAVIPGPDGGAIYTFGGDRETFDFANPENYLRVDNDVWRLTVKGG